MFSLYRRILTDNHPQASVGFVSGWKIPRPISEYRSLCCQECDMQFLDWGILSMEITSTKQVEC